jgi:cytochrome P450
VTTAAGRAGPPSELLADPDLLGADAVADPYPLLDALRAHDPVHRSARLGGWVLTRHDDVSAALRDPRFSSDRISPYVRTRLAAADAPPGVRAAFAVLERWMVFQDPPDHTRLRRLLSRAFTPRAVQRQRERITAIADELLDALLDPLRGTGRADLLAQYSSPLTASVIADVLGVPRADRGRFTAWSHQILGLVFGGTGDPDRHASAAAGMGELTAYLADLVAAHERRPADDLITALVDARDEGDALTHEEVIATGVLLLFAGHETTTNLIGNGLLALLRRPAALAAVRDGAVPIGRAVEELLRFDGPAKTIARVAAVDVELRGRTVRAGDRVFLSPAAANRDPAVFDRPAELDLTRAHNPQLGFGVGLHYCLGAPLARLEASIAIPRALRRLHGLRLTGAPLQWHPVLLSRGLRTLPVAFSSHPGGGS